MNEMVGLKYTLIKAGEHKAEMNPWEPLSPDAKDFAQGQVDEMNDMFVGAVAKQRGTSTKSINDDYGQGRCFTAKQALAAGMIDRIATLEDTLKRLGAKNVGASGRPVQASALSAPPVAVNALQQPTGTRLVRSADADPADPLRIPPIQPKTTTISRRATISAPSAAPSSMTTACVRTAAMSPRRRRAIHRQLTTDRTMTAERSAGRSAERPIQKEELSRVGYRARCRELNHRPGLRNRPRTPLWTSR
jgi:ClpP class serine protease